MQPKLLTTLDTLHNNDHGEYEVWYEDHNGKTTLMYCHLLIDAMDFIKNFPSGEVSKAAIEDKIKEADEEFKSFCTIPDDVIEAKFKGLFDGINFGRKMEDEALKAFTGIKESDGKLTYDIDWNFVEGMAARQAMNKDKYPRGNWQKKMNVEQLHDALTRHFIEIQKGNTEDGGQAFGHYFAIACNAMFIVYQLSNSGANELPY